jgi:hypothetical protein
MPEFYETNEETLNAELSKDRKESVEREGAFFLRPGVTQIRVLPPYNQKGVWYRQINEYSFVVDGQRRYMTVPSAGDPDPVAEKKEQLLSVGGQANIELARELRPRSQFLFNIVVLSAPPGTEFDPGRVYILKTGVMVKKALLHHDRDVASGWHKITDPAQGVNFSVDRSGKGLQTRYTVTPMAQRTNIVDYVKQCGKSLEPEDLFNLDELYPPLSENELKQMVIGLGTPAPAPLVPVTNPNAGLAAIPTGVPAPAGNVQAPTFDIPNPPSMNEANE